MSRGPAVPALGAVVLAALGLSACQQGFAPVPVCDMSAIAQQRPLVAAPSALPGQPSPLVEMPLNSVNITDLAIIQKIFVRGITARRTQTGTVEVTSQVVNCTDFPLHIEARTQFYDQAQGPAEPVSGWKRVYLQPRTVNTYRESSIATATAAAYMVELREGR
ncbi:MAG: hypothetical protein K2Q10_14785 [Rhodospirillales bacterium]|nr:hypothetical protein [Rhodospirillales bacterium]